MKKTFKIRASAASQIMGARGLGKTGEGYVKDWIKQELYGRKKEFSNKYTDKGNIMEDESIDFISEYYDLGFILKNEQYFENDFFTGTPDVILEGCIIDVKNSWDCFTFPLLEDKINPAYYWQAQVYMELVGRDCYELIYTLMDTPEHLIFREAKYYAINNGYETEEVIEDFKKKMTFSDLPDELRIKKYSIERNDADINKLKQRVAECRDYIKKIWN